jgi:5-methylcytosine-specific restriction endonuclease McrA
VSKGGTNSIENLVTACAECNLGKSDTSLRYETVEEKKLLRERLRNINKFNCVVVGLEDRWRTGRGVISDGR